MSFHYLPGLAEASLAPDSLDGAQSVPLSASPTASNPSSSDSGTDSLSTSPSGTMCRPSTGDPGVDAWISSLRDSHVSPSPLPVNSKPQTMSETCGPKPLGSFAKFDPDGYCWRTSQASLLLPMGICTPFSETWPKAGLIVDGAAYRLSRSVRPTSETGSGLWPTPNTAPERPCEGNVRMLRQKVLTGDMTEAEARAMLGGKSPFEAQGVIPAMASWPTPSAGWGDGGIANSGDVSPIRRRVDDGTMAYEEALVITRGAIHHKGLELWRHGEHDQYLAAHGKHYSGDEMGRLSPDWVEWLMGWPVGWTSLEPMTELGSWFGETWWDEEPVSRITTDKTNRPKRLRAIGNGQVPACVVSAWLTLGVMVAPEGTYEGHHQGQG